MTYVPESLAGRPLSPTERDILGAISEGASDAAMARALFMSESTVKTHVRRMSSKLGSRNRAHMVKRGYQLGYLRLDLDALARNPLARAA